MSQSRSSLILDQLRTWISHASRFPIVGTLLLLSISMTLPSFSFVTSMDDMLTGWRSAQAMRPASGKFVFLAIDKKSLDAVGVWPWPRTIYADVVEKLTAAGVNDIFIDIDFSARSTEDADKRLAEALENAGGGVILPVFLQHSAADQHAASVATTRPLPLLAQNAWLATATVRPDRDAHVRQFPTAEQIDGELLSSVPSVLAGQELTTPSEFLIDFSIDPETVPTFSITDMLAGSVPDSALRGRSVVIGAFATELKDVFSVPVHGVISGPMLHLLAAETLSQGRALQKIEPTPAVLGAGVALFLLLLLVWAQAMSLRVVLAGLFLASLLLEAVAFALQTYWAMVFPSTQLHLMIVAGGLLCFLAELDLSYWVAKLAGIRTRNSDRLLRQVISDSADAVIVVDPRGRVINVSETTRSILGTDHPLLPGSNFLDAAPPALARLVGKALKMCRDDGDRSHEPEEVTILVENTPRILECRITVSLLEVDATDTGQVENSFVACVTVRDMTKKRSYERQLEYLSEYDELTDSLYRGALIRRMEDEPDREWTVCAINLYRFAVVNATLGRDVGDALLRSVAARLKVSDPAIRHVGRLGSDVFCIAVDLRSDLSADVDAFAETVIAAFARPFDVPQSTVSIDVRIGICDRRAGEKTASGRVEAAEIALEAVRKTAGAGYAVYDPVSAGKRARLRMLEGDMRQALQTGDFFLVFQEQVDLATGRLLGAEALVRWQHRRLGMVSPADFISLAEANGFITELGRWVLQESCRTAMSWPAQLTVAVNVSPIQFAKGDMAREVRAILHETSLPAQRLQLEITESVFLKGTDQLTRQLHELRALGVQIALDDFGTGYSSLAYIANFPCDKIKIDQSFVRNLVTDVTSQAIVRSVSTLAAGLGLKVLAEGIEDTQQRDFLSMLGCGEGQGYLFGKPKVNDAFLAHATGADSVRPVALS
jgi:diguanylate cyclase (GGDEF)-like protein/PAS domain S-box-containing protein